MTRYRPPNDSVFPKRVQAEKLVNSKMLIIAIPFAECILRVKASKLQRHFSRFATRKYRCKPQQVKFVNTIPLLKHVYLEDTQNLGETDGKRIGISSTVPMTFDELVGVLVHECLHNYCKVRGRFMSCYNEHVCMRGLGDNCCT